MRAVLKLGGSLLYDESGEVVIDLIQGFTKVISVLAQKGNQFIIVVGGGKPARSFIAAARLLGASEAQCDWLGIKIARHNAELLCAALGDIAYPKIAETLDELEIAVCTGRIVLMGGLTPGQSTNAVAALAAEAIHADLLFNATNVDGVYDRDPDEKGAKRFQTISIGQLKQVLAGAGTRAGEYKLFDPVAIRVVERSKIKTVIFNGKDPENLRRLVNGEHIGTTITHE
jgi:uridylate kinase